ncbi:MAG: hypothetical protein B7X02_02370 [Rhodospirillales bacterium 12-54-5]|nr:MAG: hypothetical protein B7X02_02370 [Rhodospirillales bacterium 12-54-5]
MSTHTPLRLPDTMQRRDIGPYLASLRVHFGLSEQDVAARLHIRVRYLQAIERGAFDQLPGQVYARGYMFTYAEFLGLDAAQVVELCFGSQRAPEVTPPPLSATARHGRIDAAQWRAGAVVAIVAALALLVIAQLERHTVTTHVETVPPVPEEMLTHNHKMVMATPRTLDCFTTDAWSSCMLSTRVAQTVEEIESGRLDSDIEALASRPETIAEADTATQPDRKKNEHTKVTSPEHAKPFTPNRGTKKMLHVPSDHESGDADIVDPNTTEGAQ